MFSTIIYPETSKAVQASLTKAAAWFWKYASCCMHKCPAVEIVNSVPFFFFFKEDGGKGKGIPVSDSVNNETKQLVVDIFLPYDS